MLTHSGSRMHQLQSQVQCFLYLSLRFSVSLSCMWLYVHLAVLLNVFCSLSISLFTNLQRFCYFYISLSSKCFFHLFLLTFYCKWMSLYLHSYSLSLLNIIINKWYNIPPHISHRPHWTSHKASEWPKPGAKEGCWKCSFECRYLEDPPYYTS